MSVELVLSSLLGRAALAIAAAAVVPGSADAQQPFSFVALGADDDTGGP